MADRAMRRNRPAEGALADGPQKGRPHPIHRSTQDADPPSTSPLCRARQRIERQSSAVFKRDWRRIRNLDPTKLAARLRLPQWRSLQPIIGLDLIGGSTLGGGPIARNGHRALSEQGHDSFGPDR